MKSTRAVLLLLVGCGAAAAGGDTAAVAVPSLSVPSGGVYDYVAPHMRGMAFVDIAALREAEYFELLRGEVESAFSASGGTDGRYEAIMALVGAIDRAEVFFPSNQTDLDDLQDGVFFVWSRRDPGELASLILAVDDSAEVRATRAEGLDALQLGEALCAAVRQGEYVCGEAQALRALLATPPRTSIATTPPLSTLREGLPETAVMGLAGYELSPPGARDDTSGAPEAHTATAYFALGGGIEIGANLEFFSEAEASEYAAYHAQRFAETFGSPGAQALGIADQLEWNIDAEGDRSSMRIALPDAAVRSLLERFTPLLFLMASRLRAEEPVTAPPAAGGPRSLTNGGAIR